MWLVKYVDDEGSTHGVRCKTFDGALINFLSCRSLYPDNYCSLIFMGL